MDDRRIEAARTVMEEPDNFSFSHVVVVLDELLAYAEERLRINLGLLQENSGLKAKIGAPAEADLSAYSVKDLLREISSRFP